MTALSILERAREIAAKHKLGDYSRISLEWYPFENALNALTEAMHSERELCAKELEFAAKMSEQDKAFTLERAAKLLREGGQK